MSPLPHTSSDASTPESTAATRDKHQPLQKSFSCILCAQRKVKCDRAPGGCTNCTKAKVECIYKAPPPPRRRRKGVRDIDIQTKLRLYERTLEELGVDPEALVRQNLGNSAPEHPKPKDKVGINLVDDTARPGTQERRWNWEDTRAGILVSKRGKSRYLENTLWTSLQSEIRDPENVLEDSSDEEYEGDLDAASPHRVYTLGGNLLLGGSTMPNNLHTFHPNPSQIFKLWQTYLDNVNPLIKVFHTPTVQQIISNATGRLGYLPRGVEALMFSIYAISVASLSNTECEAIMGESKEVLVQRFRTATQHALTNASLLKTSDILVLQALIIFISSLINFDARVIWILTGVASRIAQRIGLHRDADSLGLPPFEGEVRRRLWFQITMQDGFAQKLAGAAGIGRSVYFGEVKRPSNINDSNLFPDMKELPPEHEGATDMMFFLIRCHLGEFLHHSVNNMSTFDGMWNNLSTRTTPLAVKDKAIDDLEAIYQRKFLNYCDGSIPLHFMCTYLVKSVISMLRFVAHCPEGTDEDLPASEKDLLFELSVNVTQWQNMAYTAKEMHGYLWHINSHFQWKAFIYIVAALKNRTHGSDVDNAWEQVRITFDFHPGFSSESKNQAIPIAVGNLTLTAWEAYVEARGVPPDGEPYFVQILRTRKENSTKSSTRQGQSSTSPEAPEQPAGYLQPNDPSPAAVPDNTGDNFLWDFGDSLDVPLGHDMNLLDYNQTNWENWDNLLMHMEMQSANGYAGDQSGNVER